MLAAITIIANTAIINHPKALPNHLPTLFKKKFIFLYFKSPTNEAIFKNPEITNNNINIDHPIPIILKKDKIAEA